MSSANDERAYKMAEDVNDISLDYHLSHATTACGVLLQQMLKNDCEKRLKELNKLQEDACRRGDTSSFKELNQEIGRLYERKRYRVYVEYLDLHEDSGRTIFIDNQLIIYLPKNLLRESRNSDGSYNKAVKQLRKLMAHELGHAVLHTGELIKMRNNLVGSNEFINTPKEREANIFAERLLELRHIRNETMRLNGTLDSYF